MKYLNNALCIFTCCVILSACNSGSGNANQATTTANNTTSNAALSKEHVTATGNLSHAISFANGIQPIMNHQQLKNGTGIDGSPITALTKDQNGNIYAGMDSGNVWELKNGASSWVAINSKQNSPDNHAITAIAVIGNNVYTATTMRQTWLSTNNGAWQKLAFDSVSDQPQYFSSLTVDGSGNVYAGAWRDTNGSIFKLSTKTNSWKKLSDLPKNYNGLITAIITDNNSNIYIGSTNIGNLTTGNMVLKYTGTWTVIGNNSPDNSSITSLKLSSNGNIYAGTYNGNVMTVSNSSWNKVGGVSPDNSPIDSIVVDPNNNIYAATENGFVYSSNGVGIWLKLPSVSSNISPIDTLTIDSNGILYAGVESGYVYRYSTSNTSNNWEQMIGGLGSITNATASNDGTIFAATNNNRVWEYGINTPTQQLGHSPDGSSINAITIDSNKNVYVVTSSQNIFEYQTNSINWQQLGSTFTTSPKVITVSNDGNIYVGDASGNIWQYQGNSWTVITTILNFSTIYTLGGDYYGDTTQNCGDGPCYPDAIVALTTDSNDNLYAEGTSGNVWNITTMLTSPPNLVPYSPGLFPNYWGAIGTGLANQTTYFAPNVSVRSMVIDGNSSYTMTTHHLWQCSTTNINLVATTPSTSNPSCNNVGSSYYGYTLSPVMLLDNSGNIYIAGQNIETNLSTVFRYLNGKSDKQTIGNSFNNPVLSLTTDSNGIIYATTTGHSWQYVQLGSWQNTGASN